MKLSVWFFCFLFGFTLATQTVWGAGLLSGEDIDFELFVNDRFHFFNEYFDSGRKKFNQDRNLHIFYINSSITSLLGPHIQGVLEVEAELIYDLDSDDFDDDLEVRNAYIQALIPGWNWMTFSAGRHAISTMGGLIYDDEAPALRLQADLERGFEWPFKFKAFVAEVENDSPYIHAELKYNFSFLESVTFSYGWFRDTNDGVARIFNYLEEERIYRSRGRMQWFGFSVRKFLGDALLRAAFIYEKGSVRLRQKKTGSTTMQMRGYLIDVNCDYSFSDSFSMSLFFYLSSGDNRPEKGTLRSFISIDPYVDKTNIFFNGGIDSQFSSDNVGLNGIQLPGVMTPGLAMDCRIGKNAWIKTVFAYLFTHKGTGGEGHIYGWEADFMGYYNLSDNLQLFAELNVFDPGDYFKKITSHRDHISTEIIIGLNYLFSN
jgi:hypothetical protein